MTNKYTAEEQNRAQDIANRLSQGYTVRRVDIGNLNELVTEKLKVILRDCKAAVEQLSDY